MKDICGTTGLACIRCNPGACSHRQCNMDKLIKEIVCFLSERKVTIKATADESLIITDQKTGEERLLKDLGYPF